MESIICLLAFPLLMAGLVIFAKTQKAISLIVRSGAVILLLLTAVAVAINFNATLSVSMPEWPWLKYAILAFEAILAGYIIFIAIRSRRWLLMLFSLTQIALLIVLELIWPVEVHVTKSIYIDKLSLLMIAIAGVIGSLICIFAVEYMKDYHKHHPEFKDRRGLFFALLFIFLSAMFGLVICNDLTLLLFFWEITTFCSFLLIGYSQTQEAKENSMLALVINVGGGLAFTIGIFILATQFGVMDFESILSIEKTPLREVAILMLAIAGLTKSAQMPFSKWLLGAMAGPTPSSALLHSSTMVKAGVYLILRLAPMLGTGVPGTVVTLVGGITFLVAAILAITQTDAKKILAYSTISNLGLIVTCAGINMAESLWAAIMLITFHAVAKSLLFCAVGSTEHLLGSRNVEDMDGLFRISTALTMLLIIGIAGMFVAPFGMLISKWAAMKAFLDSKNVFIAIIVAFGSTLTLFFWTKWMGKLISNANRRNPTGYFMRLDEKVSMYTMAGLVIVICLLHPVISDQMVIPYIDSNLHINFVAPINPLDTTIIILMMCMLFVMPLIFIPLFKVKKVDDTTVYLSGENTGDDESFRTSKGEIAPIEMRNWYMERFFRPALCDKVGFILCSTIILAGLLAVLEGVAL